MYENLSQQAVSPLVFEEAAVPATFTTLGNTG